MREEVISCATTAEEVRTMSKTGFFSFGQVSLMHVHNSHTMYSRMAAAKLGSEAIFVVRMFVVVLIDCAELVL